MLASIVYGFTNAETHNVERTSRGLVVEPCGFRCEIMNYRGEIPNVVSIPKCECTALFSWVLSPRARAEEEERNRVSCPVRRPRSLEIWWAARRDVLVTSTHKDSLVTFSVNRFTKVAIRMVWECLRIALLSKTTMSCGTWSLVYWRATGLWRRSGLVLSSIMLLHNTFTQFFL
jgi:hypothetical protein